jgi:hypothetical protein
LLKGWPSASPSGLGFESAFIRENRRTNNARDRIAATLTKIDNGRRSGDQQLDHEIKTSSHQQIRGRIV